MRILSPTLAVLFISLVFFSASARGGSLTSDASGLLLYDNELDVYWTKSGNLHGGMMTWDEVNDWLNELNTQQYGGYNDWRLPTTPDGDWGYNSNINKTKYNVATSELGHLYYVTLGLSGKLDINGKQNANFGLRDAGAPFDSLQSASYWFGTISNTKVDGQPAAWKFDFEYGAQFLDDIDNKAYAIAVRSASPAPEPSTALLFLIGLSGLYRARFR